MNSDNEESSAKEEENINDTDVDCKVGGGGSDNEEEEDVSTDDVLPLENAQKQVANTSAQNADKKALDEKNVVDMQAKQEGLEEVNQEKIEDEKKEDLD
mmetsp:Transcript_1083/g.1394  ORF Transcript_1083/g.1394 Transcript_1083/m.1394 type:complete len:99 (-) Transcript_1083:161-457(-)